MAEASKHARRALAQAGRQLGASGVTVRVGPPAERVSLRASGDAISALSAALGLDLPVRPCVAVTADGRHALKLGPDEWLVIDEAGRKPAEDCAKSGVLHSAVDVSHRNVAILVEGPGAEEVLTAGCPLDLHRDVFPAGSATRTVFGKIEIVLFRVDVESFRVECWRSYSDYALDLLEAAMADR